VIYKSEMSGTFRFENDMSISDTIKIGYRVGDVNKVSEIHYEHLPDDIKKDLAKVTNRIARFIEKETRR